MHFKGQYKETTCVGDLGAGLSREGTYKWPLAERGTGKEVCGCGTGMWGVVRLWGKLGDGWETLI